MTELSACGYTAPTHRYHGPSMTSFLIGAARVLTPYEDLSPGWVLVDGEKIAAVGSGDEVPADVHVSDLGDVTLVPGFVDVHVHGGGGFSLMTSDVQEVEAYARWVVSHGVTSFLSTIVGGNIAQGVEFVQAAATAAGTIESGAEVLGVNLEGPVVSERRRGALPRGWLRGPEAALIDMFADAANGNLRLVTIAPDVDGECGVLARALQRGIRVAIGHTDVDSDHASSAFNAGASHVTHLFNAMRPFHHRDPGILGALFDRAGGTAEVIADGIHLDPTTVDMAVRLLGPGRIALVSDAVKPAGMPGGSFRLGDNEAHFWGDRIILEDGTLAGGAETMEHLVRNVVRWKAATLPEAVRMASTVPADVAGVSDRKGRIAPGFDADMAALTPELTVAGTWVRGVPVFSQPGFASAE
jgi:N-acetylglucosamine-6-phosphate deacetylase